MGEGLLTRAEMTLTAASLKATPARGQLTKLGIWSTVYTRQAAQPVGPLTDN